MDIVTREEWGAVHERGYETAGAKLFLYIHHAAQRAPNRTLAAETARWREYERQHPKRLKLTIPRIGYTAGITQSGRILEGTGFGYVGAHTAGRNSSGWGVCFLMDGTVEEPTDEAVEAYLDLRQYAVKEGWLSPAFVTRGHRDEVATSCPGDILYNKFVVQHMYEPQVQGESAIAPMPTLRKGSGGKNAPADLREAVRELQRRLNMVAKHRTGYFWTITEMYVRRFQRANGLKVDGIVGPKTWKRLFEVGKWDE